MKGIKIVTVICYLIIVLQCAKCDPFNLLNIKDSVIGTATGIVKKVPNVIPSPQTIFSSSKNLIVGYPFSAISEAINIFCSTALSENTIKPKLSPDLKKLNFLLIKKVSQINYSIPLENPELLWQHKEFNKNWNTTILVTGWSTNYEESQNSAMETIAEAYLCRGNFNFVVIDTAQFLDTLYTWSAFNTEDIANLVAMGLKQLSASYPMEKVHLIGHSLGAHIVGSIGRNYDILTGKLIRRITGLDPAKPCFNEGQQLSGLSRGDAEFVDVIHSNPGALGKSEPIGDADFYPNGLDPLPPGCITIVCAHGRAWEYYAETVYPGNEYGFMGVKCTSQTALNNGYCNGRAYPMGYAVPFNLKGNYFLSTNSNSPYGKAGNKDKSQIKCNA